MKPLWRRYLTTRRAVPKRPGIIGRAIGNWKQFLLAEAYNDPMAIVLILANREMLNVLLGGSPRKATDKSIPRAVSGPIERWSRMSAGSDLNGEGDELSVRASMNWKADFMDGKGTAVEMRRNEQDVIVGLLVISPEGKFLAISNDDALLRPRWVSEVNRNLMAK